MSVLHQGPFNRRPNGPLTNGYQYRATDQRITYEWNGAAWQTMEADKRTVDFRRPDEWDQFEAVNVTNPGHSIHLLSVANGVGTITGSPGTAGNDRWLYLLSGDYRDVEVVLEQDSPDAQTGIVLRAADLRGSGTPDTAVTAHANTFFPGRFDHHVWEFDGSASLLDDNDTTIFTPLAREIFAATGDGADVTVDTYFPHQVVVGETVNITGTGLWDGFQLVTAVPSPTSFQFAEATAGGPVGGTYEQIFSRLRKRTAFNLVGDRFRCTVWWPDVEVRPSLYDPVRSRTGLLPATLGGSGGSPPAIGQVGIIGNHLDDDNTVNVYRVTVEPQ